VLCEVHHQRCGVHVRMPLEPELDNDVDTLPRDPLRSGRIQAAPRDPGGAVGFLSLDREEEVGGAGIAGHDLHFGAQHAIEDIRKYDAVGAGAGSGDDHFTRTEVVDGLEWLRMPGQDQAYVGGEAANPVELHGVVLDTGAIKKRLHGKSASE